MTRSKVLPHSLLLSPAYVDAPCRRDHMDRGNPRRSLPKLGEEARGKRTRGTARNRLINPICTMRILSRIIGHRISCQQGQGTRSGRCSWRR